MKYEGTFFISLWVVFIWVVVMMACDSEIIPHKAAISKAYLERIEALK